MKTIHTFLENKLNELPLLDFRFLSVSDIEFSANVRNICEMNDCTRYGKCRNCPPLVGSIDDCIKRVLHYDHCLVFSTVAEVNDTSNFDECLAARIDHEQITADLLKLAGEYSDFPFALSSGCIFAKNCAFPEQPCRNLHAIPTIESHGIIIMKLASQLGMDYEMGENYVVYFSMLFFH